MLKKPQYRHKPIYKKFVSLKVNVQYRRRLLLLKFKKQKWQKIIFYLKRLQKRRKKNFQIFDLNKINLPKQYNPFRRKFKTTLQDKSKIKTFYGNMSDRHLKKSIQLLKSNKKKKLKSWINLNIGLIQSFEKRLDVILYRAHFVNSIRSSKQLILHSHVKINNKTITNNSYKVKQGDQITINEKNFRLIHNNIYSSHIWPLPPKYLQINYKTLEILINNKIEYENLSTFFPFFPSFYNLITFDKI